MVDEARQARCIHGRVHAGRSGHLADDVGGECDRQTGLDLVVGHGEVDDVHVVARALRDRAAVHVEVGRRIARRDVVGAAADIAGIGEHVRLDRGNLVRQIDGAVGVGIAGPQAHQRAGARSVEVPALQAVGHGGIGDVERRAGEIDGGRSGAVECNGQRRRHAEVVAVLDRDRIAAGRRVEGDGAGAVDVDDVAVALEQCRARGHDLVRAVAQADQHPVDDGVAAGDGEHARRRGLAAAAEADVMTERGERLGERHEPRGAQIVAHQAAAAVIGARQDDAGVENGRARADRVRIPGRVEIERGKLVDRSDGDSNRRGIGLVVAVRQRVGERWDGAVPVRRGLEDKATSDAQRQLADRAAADDDRCRGAERQCVGVAVAVDVDGGRDDGQWIAVRVAVDAVRRDDVGDEQRVLGRRQHVVHGDRRLVGVAEVEVVDEWNRASAIGRGVIVGVGEVERRADEIVVVDVEAVADRTRLEDVEEAVAVGVGRGADRRRLAVAALGDVGGAVVVAVGVEIVGEIRAVRVDGNQAERARCAGRSCGVIGIVETVAICIGAGRRDVARRRLRLDVVGDAVVVRVDVEVIG